MSPVFDSLERAVNSRNFGFFVIGIGKPLSSIVGIVVIRDREKFHHPVSVPDKNVSIPRDIETPESTQLVGPYVQLHNRDSGNALSRRLESNYENNGEQIHDPIDVFLRRRDNFPVFSMRNLYQILEVFPKLSE